MINKINTIHRPDIEPLPLHILTREFDKKLFLLAIIQQDNFEQKGNTKVLRSTDYMVASYDLSKEFDSAGQVYLKKVGVVEHYPDLLS